MDQTTAGHHDLLHLGEVFALLHKGLTHHGISFLDRSGVSAHCFPDRKRCQSKIQRLQLLIIVGNFIGVRPQIRDQFLCPILRQA